ncbi:MAG: uroporphyrinogen decarboxylase family protein, partial [Armatimonadota bacterium]
MSPRERVRRVLEHEETDVIPYYFDFTPPARQMLARRLGRDDVEDAIGNHLALIGPTGQKPLYAPPERYGDEITDEFGVTWHTDPYDRGVVKWPALPEPSLAGYAFPPAEIPERFEDVPGRIAANEGKFIVAPIGDLFERAAFMRGVGAFLEDIAVRPRFVDELLDGLLDYVLRTQERMMGFAIDAIFLSDDYGHQHRLAISPRDWRRIVKPRLAEVFAQARARGKATMLHSCGHIEDIVPDLIEIGLDILHPIQPEANDIFRLKREFG